MGQFSKDGKYCPNTVESIREACSKPGWDGYDAKIIPEVILDYAEKLQSYDLLPSGFEMFPCADGSIQFEYPDTGDDFDIFEIYNGEFIHSYKDGYRGFYDWDEFLRYISTLMLKLTYIVRGKVSSIDTE